MLQLFEWMLSYISEHHGTLTTDVEILLCPLLCMQTTTEDHHIDRAGGTHLGLAEVLRHRRHTKHSFPRGQGHRHGANAREPQNYL